MSHEIDLSIKKHSCTKQETGKLFVNAVLNTKMNEGILMYFNSLF